MSLFYKIGVPKLGVFGIIIVLSVSSFIYAQNTPLNDDVQKEITEESSAAPKAVPVLSQTEAQKTDIVTPKDPEKKADDQIASENQAKSLIVILIGIIFLVSIFISYKKKTLRRNLIKIYKSPLGRMFYCTRLCRWDYFAILIVFGITFFFSMLAGQRAMLRGFIGGRWYPHFVVIPAISFYNNHGIEHPVVEPGSELDNFMKKGSKGDLEFRDISSSKAKPLDYKEVNWSSNESAYFGFPGLPFLISLWWRIIGHPNWSSLYILFSIFYGLTAIAAYCALRQVTGLIPAIFLGMMFSLFPTTMYEAVFSPRDAGRAFFCFSAIALLLYLLKHHIKWKGTIICSVLLFVLCSLFTCFRNDYIVVVPFIVCSILFFQGKFFSNYPKKFILLSSIILGIISALCIPRERGTHAFSHVLYIGLADHPFMDDLHYSADNYSKGIAYLDPMGFTVAQVKAYRDKKQPFRLYSKEYAQELNEELFSLFQVFPYDFLRLAISSSIQSCHIGTRFYDRNVPYIEYAPGYWLTSLFSKNIFNKASPWLYLVIISASIILCFGGKPYRSLVFFLAVIPLTGCYLFQFDIRHYSYLLLIPLLATGFVWTRIIQILFLFFRNWRRVVRICRRKLRFIVGNYVILVALFSLAFLVLFCAEFIQKYQIKKEINSFYLAKTEKIEFESSNANAILDNQKGTLSTEVLFPGLLDKILQESPAKQTFFSEFLKIKIDIKDLNSQEKLYVFAKYDNTSQYSPMPLDASKVILQTGTFPIPMAFPIETGSYTLYLPVYMRRDKSPLIGVELEAGGSPIEVTSVERIVDTDNIRTQSTFFVPDQSDLFCYSGDIAWNRVFFGVR